MFLIVIEMAFKDFSVFKKALFCLCKIKFYFPFDFSVKFELDIPL